MMTLTIMTMIIITITAIAKTITKTMTMTITITMPINNLHHPALGGSPDLKPPRVPPAPHLYTPILILVEPAVRT